MRRLALALVPRPGPDGVSRARGRDAAHVRRPSRMAPSSRACRRSRICSPRRRPRASRSSSTSTRRGAAPAGCSSATSFPKEEVVAALKAFVCARYDAQDGEGIDVASRYAVRGYPTLVVVDAEGEEIDRIIGYHALTAFVAEAQRIARGENTLPALMKALAANPDDFAALLALARRERNSDEAAAAKPLRAACSRAPRARTPRRWPRRCSRSPRSAVGRAVARRWRRTQKQRPSTWRRSSRTTPSPRPRGRPAACSCVPHARAARGAGVEPAVESPGAGAEGRARAGGRAGGRAARLRLAPGPGRRSDEEVGVGRREGRPGAERGRLGGVPPEDLAEGRA